MKIYVGADHRGFNLKEKLKTFLKKYNYLDLGNKKYNKEDDYPVFAEKVAKKVSKEKEALGILICGSGQGMAIAANKIKGIRAALAEHVKDAYSAKRDDKSNIICLQADSTNVKKAQNIIKKFMETEFKDIKRYKRRVKEIKILEQ